MKSLEDIVRDLARLFEADGMTYALMGGLAVRIHALPRPTFDVDFTILLDRQDLPDLYRRVEAMGYTVPPAQQAGWVDVVQGLPVIKIQLLVGGRPIDVDLFLAETPYQRELLARRRRCRTDGLEAWFVTPEDPGLPRCSMAVQYFALGMWLKKPVFSQVSNYGHNVACEDANISSQWMFAINHYTNSSYDHLGSPALKTSSC